MPRKKRSQGQAYVAHTWSVFVDTINDDGTTTSTMVYFGSSEYSARQALVKAIMEHPNAYSIDVRKDLRTLVRVKIEHPPSLL
jgi:hypothetical protein